MEIRLAPQGYYSLYLDGVFEGNYDNQMEAVLAAEGLMHPLGRVYGQRLWRLSVVGLFFGFLHLFLLSADHSSTP